MSATLGRLIEIFGAAAVVAETANMTSPLDLREVRRRLNRPGRLAKRQATRERQRAKHADTVVWRGVLDVSAARDVIDGLRPDVDFDGRHQRHGGRARGCVRKSLLPVPLQIREYDTGLETEHEVPAETRVVIVERRPLGSICTAELVECVGRPMRLHLWTRVGEYDEVTGRLERVPGTHYVGDLIALAEARRGRQG